MIRVFKHYKSKVPCFTFQIFLSMPSQYILPQTENIQRLNDMKRFIQNESAFFIQQWWKTKNFQ